MEISANSDVQIFARVFRGHPAPRFFPTALWNFLRARRVPFTGHWENHGMVASSKQGTAKLV